MQSATFAFLDKGKGKENKRKKDGKKSETEKKQQMDQ